jgi:hypothetical protein
MPASRAGRTGREGPKGRHVGVKESIPRQSAQAKIQSTPRQRVSMESKASSSFSARYTSAIFSHRNMPARACRVLVGRKHRLGNGWALVDLGDFKSLCRAMPSEVGSIPTHSRQFVGYRRVECPSPKFEQAPLRTPTKVVLIAMVAFAAHGAMSPARAQTPPDSTAADSLRAVVVDDSLGVPGTLKGQTVQESPEQTK